MLIDKNFSGNLIIREHFPWFSMTVITLIYIIVFLDTLRHCCANSHQIVNPYIVTILVVLNSSGNTVNP